MNLPPDALLALVLHRDFTVRFSIDPVVVLIVATLVLLGVAVIVIRRHPNGWFRARSFEVDGAALGIGKSSILIRPSEVDRQIAYKIWVELSTRKLGLPVNLDDDVIAEVYDSWYRFFSITRELIKDVPVHKVRQEATKQIVELSVRVLNSGIRPHLTKWQARFRHWYSNTLQLSDSATLSPQEIQRCFPEYDLLRADLLHVNRNLIAYRDSMYRLATGRDPQSSSAE